jgi:ACT domain-containing protein
MADLDRKQWLTPAEAAEYLGISRSRIYHLKDKLSHFKGRTKQSRVLFLKENLLEDYLNS